MRAIAGLGKESRFIVRTQIFGQFGPLHGCLELEGKEKELARVILGFAR